MAGGMGKRDGRALGERTRAKPLEPERPEAQHDIPERHSVVRHVWVISPPEAAGRWPGVLVEWRRTAVGAWEARVLYAVGIPAARPAICVERWLAADEVVPA